MKSWEQVPADARPKLIEAAQKIADSFAPDLVKSDGEAIAVMKKYGLKINEVPKQAREEWTQLMDRIFSGLVGKMYDRESFEMASRYLEEYLAEHPRK
jgi:TRAP-type C4-dicarboxylate transport system substrate-binding protein